MQSRIAALAVFVAALACSRPALAIDPPRLAAHVNDYARILTEGERQALEAKLSAYEQSTGHQFAVLIIPSLEGDPIEDLSIRVAEQWKLGDAKRDDGLILLVAIQERQMRIEVGYGLEGAVPDAIAARIRRDIITPEFRAGRFAAGIDAGIDALMKAAQGESIGVAPRSTASRGGGQLGPSLAFVFFVLVFLSVVTRRLPGLVRAPVSAVLGVGLGVFLFQSLLIAVLGGLIGFLFGLVPHRSGWFGVGGLGGGGFGGLGGGGWGGGGGDGGGWGGGGGGFGGGGSSGSW